MLKIACLPWYQVANCQWLREPSDDAGERVRPSTSASREPRFPLLGFAQFSGQLLRRWGASGVSCAGTPRSRDAGAGSSIKSWAIRSIAPPARAPSTARVAGGFEARRAALIDGKTWRKYSVPSGRERPPEAAIRRKSGLPRASSGGAGEPIPRCSVRRRAVVGPPFGRQQRILSIPDAPESTGTPSRSA
jgi:hypothetical protein